MRSIFHNSRPALEGSDDKHRHQFPCAFKGLYDLTFSKKKFYVDSRAELKNGIGYSIEQFRVGYYNPTPAPEKSVLIRKPFKMALYILLSVALASMIAGSIMNR
jgi:hypothetical protein